jgi:quinol monooxygenase YgiN
MLESWVQERLHNRLGVHLSRWVMTSCSGRAAPMTSRLCREPKPAVSTAKQVRSKPQRDSARSLYSRHAERQLRTPSPWRVQRTSRHLKEYNAILKEESEASIRLEPGAISIFPMYQQQNPTEVRILEIYASIEAYKAHINTPHFQKIEIQDDAAPHGEITQAGGHGVD